MCSKSRTQRLGWFDCDPSVERRSYPRRKEERMTNFGSPKSVQRNVVLVVDDHPVTRQGLAAALPRQHDLETREAAGINEALLLLREQHVDVMLVDLFLTAGSG